MNYDNTNRKIDAGHDDVDDTKSHKDSETPESTTDSLAKSNHSKLGSQQDKDLLDSKTEANKDKITPSYPTHQNKKRFFSIFLAIVPIIVLGAMIYFLTSPYGQNIISTGIPLPEITIEKIEFHDNQIIAFIRNTGPEEVTISQADINDRIHSAAIEPSQTLSRLSEARVIIPFLWNPAEPYEVGITTSDGTRFSNTVEAAAPAPIPNINQVTLFAILGIFVGVIPVLIGLVWYPFLRKISRNQYNFFLSLTAGLLVFLGVEAFLESNEIAAAKLAPVFNGQMLIPVVLISTFLGLYFLSEYFIKKAESKQSFSETNSLDSYERPQSIEDVTKDKKQVSRSSKESNYLPDNNDNLLTQTSTKNGENSRTLESFKTNNNLVKSLAISLMVAIGIGLHNFGEGLAIGAAVLLGEVALSTFLIIGFTIHNTTEGLAIVAPLAKAGKLMIRRLIILGLIAGIPTILGAWVGGFIYSPLASVIFLAVGAGAIFQVVYALIVWMSKSFKESKTEQGKSSIIKGLHNVDTVQTGQILTNESKNSGLSIIAGFILGMLIMYLTGLLV
jgi:zinc transporter, ZIP family